MFARTISSCLLVLSPIILAGCLGPGFTNTVGPSSGFSAGSNYSVSNRFNYSQVNINALIVDRNGKAVPDVLVVGSTAGGEENQGMSDSGGRVRLPLSVSPKETIHFTVSGSAIDAKGDFKPSVTLGGEIQLHFKLVGKGLIEISELRNSRKLK